MYQDNTLNKATWEKEWPLRRKELDEQRQQLKEKLKNIEEKRKRSSEIYKRRMDTTLKGREGGIRKLIQKRVAHAATSIQKVVRGRIDRRRAVNLHIEKTQTKSRLSLVLGEMQQCVSQYMLGCLQREEGKIIVLQSYFRGFIQRKKFKTLLIDYRRTEPFCRKIQQTVDYL